MKKLGGVCLAIGGAVLAAVGIASAVKGNKKDKYVDVTDCGYYDVESDKCTDVEVIED